MIIRQRVGDRQERFFKGLHRAASPDEEETIDLSSNEDLN